MKKISSLFLLSILFISCEPTTPSTTDGKTEQSVEESPIDSNQIMFRPEAIGVLLDDTINNTSQSKQFINQVINVKIHSIVGYGQDSIFAIESALLLQRIINSPEFKTEILKQDFKHDNGLNPQEIYDQIMQAHELDGPGGQDKTIDLRLRVINYKEDGARWMKNCKPGSAAGTVGIDGSGSGIAAVCPEWLRSTAQSNKKGWLAAHFMHEYMHILNFSHPSRRSKSVPYKIQFIIEKLAEEFALRVEE